MIFLIASIELSILSLSPSHYSNVQLWIFSSFSYFSNMLSEVKINILVEVYRYTDTYRIGGHIDISTISVGANIAAKNRYNTPIYN